MEQEIQKIIKRQYNRLISALEPLDLPEYILDSISKYIRFMEIDIIEVVNKSETGEVNGNQGQFNR